MGARVRIGGVVWPGEVPADAVVRLRAALGEGARVLVGDGRVHDADPDRWPERADTPGAWVTAEAARGSLTLRRDPVGHRSLYWASPRRGALVFASTLAGVLATGLVPGALNPAAVARFLVYAYLPGVETLVQGVYALPAGSELHFDGAEVRVRAVWRLPPADAQPPDEATLRAELRAELDTVVGEHLPPEDQPLLATLSGGIDSSLVLALARRQRGGPARALSITFGAPHRDELEWSGLVARHVGAEQEVVTVSPGDVRARFDDTVQALSVPNGDPLTVPNLLLFEAARAHGDTLLNGEGGDPTFGGPKNGPMLLSALFDDEPPGPAYLRAHQRLYDDLEELLAPDLRAEAHLRDMEAAVEADLAERPGLVDALMAVNVVYKGAWHILPKVDQLGGRAGVRPRSPLFDVRLVERAFRMAGPMKRRGAVEKYLLKEAVRDVLPAAIVDRPKSGMMVPVEAWFSGELQAWAGERLLESPFLAPLVRRPVVEDMLRGRRLGLRPRRGVKLWCLLTLESWLRGAAVG